MDWTAIFEPIWTASLLPSNATSWGRVVESVDADLVAREPVGLIAASRHVDEVPSQWLAWLAEERSVDEFSSAWPLARQQGVTREALPLHQVKGTRPSLNRALTPLGYQLNLTEWFEPATPFQADTFRIKVDVDVDLEWIGGRDEIIRVANGAKNAHTKLTVLEVRRPTRPANVYVGAYARRVRTIRVGQLPKIGNISKSAFVWVGAAQKLHRTIRISQV